jgi:hypothetical protein
MMPWPHVESDTFKRRRPLKYQTGAEVAETVVLDYSVVSQDSSGRRLVNDGTLLTKITASGKYGPYDGSATDGRQTVTRGSAYVLWGGCDVALGDKAVAGLFQNCVFDASELTIGGEGRYTQSTVPSALTDAFPTCTFDD